MIKQRESNISFEFPDKCKVIKFDDSNFYRQVFIRLPGGKGVDFLIDSDKSLIFLEVKNCMGHERENKNRTKTRRDGRAGEETHSFGADTFDEEVSAKVAMSLACLVGAYTKGDTVPNAQALAPYCESLISEKVRTQQKEVVVILVLEGDFNFSKTRSKKMIMERIQQSIQSKLSWLATKNVHVIDHNTYKQRYFKMHM